MGRQGRNAVIWGTIAAVLAAAVLIVLWRWVLDQPEDIRLSYMQTAAVIFPGAAAVAAFGSLVAAWAARSAAKASADTARDAREALAFHYRPTGRWQTWTSYEWEGAQPPDPLDVLGEDIGTLGDQVKAQFFIPNEVENPRIWYGLADGSEHGPVPITTDRLVLLPGAIGYPKDRNHPAWGAFRARTNLRWWRVECYEPQGRMRWRAAGTVEQLHGGMGMVMEFDIIRD